MSFSKKSYLLLDLYEGLRRGEEINRRDFCHVHHVSSATFYRYIKEVREFVENKYKSHQIVYEPKEEGYCLIREKKER